jgi:predicted phosphoadenosine phosphosulfate sulfurtransferase
MGHLAKSQVREYWTGEGVKHFRGPDVYEMAKRRIAWLLDEFPSFFVSVSGGKDSCVLFNLALEVAREKDRLPLNVFWIDQEAEWQGTVDTIEQWMSHPDVNPLWLQVPFRIFNATSKTDHWLYAWDPAAEDSWMRPHHPLALTQNVYGTDRFAKLFPAAIKYHFADGKACSISGVRCEEARTRTMGLTTYATYKWLTWGSVADKARDQYTFYPLYDWTLKDVWHAIEVNQWSYNPVYDLMYQAKVPVHKMRISNLHHETAVWQLFFLQEVEPDTYAALVNRVGGIDMAGKMGWDDYFPKTLPWMFDSWAEYRDHLLEHVVGDEYRDGMARVFAAADARTPPGHYRDWLNRAMVKCILTNDWEGAKLEHIIRNQGFMDAQWRWLNDQGIPAGPSRLPYHLGAVGAGEGERLEPQ